MDPVTHPLTKAVIHLDRITHNMRLLQAEVGDRPLWPAIKANAYGHGAEPVARHLTRLGYHTLCVAQIAEAAALIDAGVPARFLVLSATFPDQAEAIVAYGCEPVVCTRDMANALANAAAKASKSVSIHLKVDTGMGRVGIRPQDVTAFLDHCRELRPIHVRGLMSHFASADAADKTVSHQQIERFRDVVAATAAGSACVGIDVRHMANSAAVLDLPDSHFDAARPGIAIYGLAPSPEVRNPRVHDLQPVLEWKTRVTFLKEVPAGTGLSYGHAFQVDADALIATIPVGYGDGLPRRLSNDLEVLVGGVRCRQVGRITMDQSLVDVTRLRGRVALGDEVVLIGRQGAQEVSADELAGKLGTINYEIVTGISHRVPRVVVGG